MLPPFDLTASSPAWGIAGDWLEEYSPTPGVIPQALRLGLYLPDGWSPDADYGSGDGSSGGLGWGRGSGAGNGSGSGGGMGVRRGNGNGRGWGNGRGCGGYDRND